MKSRVIFEGHAGRIVLNQDGIFAEVRDGCDGMGELRWKAAATKEQAFFVELGLHFLSNESLDEETVELLIALRLLSRDQFGASPSEALPT